MSPLILSKISALYLFFHPSPLLSDIKRGTSGNDIIVVAVVVLTAIDRVIKGNSAPLIMRYT